MKKPQGKRNGSLLNSELFRVFKELYPDEESCIQAVREAQRARLVYQKQIFETDDFTNY